MIRIWRPAWGILASLSWLGLVTPPPAAIAQTPAPWYNCYTREAWTPEKQTWCDQLTRLKNLAYTLPQVGSDEGPDIGPVPLRDGLYENPDDSLLVTFVERPGALAFADLNGDGQEDAAVMVAVNTGGSSVFLYLVAVLKDGETWTPQSAIGLGDRVYPEAIIADQGLIAVDLIVQGPEDPQCCPTWQTRQLFRLQPDLTAIGTWAQVTGTISYRERLSLPPGAEVQVTLVDVSRADAPAEQLAAQTLVLGGQQVPVPFALTFDPQTIDPRHTYAVQARIEVDGQLRFISDTQFPVLTQGHPSIVDLTLRPIAP